MPPTSGPVFAPQSSHVQLVNVGPHEQAHLNRYKPGTPSYYDPSVSPEERERLRQEARMRNIRKEKGGTRRRSRTRRVNKKRLNKRSRKC
jgi:hypothetical protein